jgi:hypothetical protein
MMHCERPTQYGLGIAMRVRNRGCGSTIGGAVLAPRGIQLEYGRVTVPLIFPLNPVKAGV